jgi:hypothetical protein
MNCDRQGIMTLICRYAAEICNLQEKAADKMQAAVGSK